LIEWSFVVIVLNRRQPFGLRCIAHAPKQVNGAAGCDHAGYVEGGTPSPAPGACRCQVPCNASADIMRSIPQAEYSATLFDTEPVRQAARAGTITHALHESIKSPEEHMHFIGYDGTKNEVNNGCQQHTEG